MDSPRVTQKRPLCSSSDFNALISLEETDRPIKKLKALLEIPKGNSVSPFTGGFQDNSLAEDSTDDAQGGNQSGLRSEMR